MTASFLCYIFALMICHAVWCIRVWSCCFLRVDEVDFLEGYVFRSLGDGVQRFCAIIPSHSECAIVFDVVYRSKFAFCVGELFADADDHLGSVCVVQERE